MRSHSYSPSQFESTSSTKGFETSIDALCSYFLPFQIPQTVISFSIGFVPAVYCNTNERPIAFSGSPSKRKTSVSQAISLMFSGACPASKCIKLFSVTTVSIHPMLTDTLFNALFTALATDCSIPAMANSGAITSRSASSCVRFFNDTINFVPT